jgi:hypothetical protein
MEKEGKVYLQEFALTFSGRDNVKGDLNAGKRQILKETIFLRPPLPPLASLECFFA